MFSTDLAERFHIEQNDNGSLFVVDGDNEFPSEFAGTLPAAETLKAHRNGKHLSPRNCRACVETPGMTLPLPHDPAAGFGDPNLSFGKSA